MGDRRPVRTQRNADNDLRSKIPQTSTPCEGCGLSHATSDCTRDPNSKYFIAKDERYFGGPPHPFARLDDYTLGDERDYNWRMKHPLGGPKQRND